MSSDGKTNRRNSSQIIMMVTQSFRWISLISFFGLMFTLIAWIVIAPHGEYYPVSTMLLLGVVPLLFPMRGLLYAKPYTHAWTSFLMLFYFSFSVGEVYSADSLSIYPVLALIFSSTCFLSAIFFIKSGAKKKNTSQNKS